MKIYIQHALILPLLLAAAGCSTSPARSSDAAASGPTSAGAPSDLAWDDSDVEIVYTLGHSRRLIRMESRVGAVKAEFTMDKRLLKQSLIEPSHYKEYLSKVAEFLNHKRGLASSPKDANPDCHSPYKIQLRSGKDTQAYSGCRMSDEGRFSKLVKESEFLILSGK